MTIIKGGLVNLDKKKVLLKYPATLVSNQFGEYGKNTIPLT